MWIAVCDDDQYENDLVVNLINEYAVQYDYDLHCRSFSSGESLLRCDQGLRRG